MPAGSRRLVWSVQAEKDLVDIWDYLAAEAAPSIADQQLRRIDEACRNLSEWPFSGRPRSELRADLRSLTIWPYVAFYRVSDLTCEIVRVLHGQRDLGAMFSDRWHD